MSHMVSIRLPEMVEKALQKLAQSTERPKTYLIRKAIELYLEEYQDYQIALERLRDHGDALISGAELRRRLAR